MSDVFQLRILTLEKVVFEGEVVSMVAPGSEGYFGVLAHHAPLIATLAPGKLAVRHEGGGEFLYAVSGGFLEVSGNGAIVLADSVEKACDIDPERAEAAKGRALERLRTREEEVDVARAEAALARALNRLRVYQSQLRG
ncbi:MAG: F0F1 ATP synthase subunit epsilon [Candidatus Eisenbacteria bacterium]